MDIVEGCKKRVFVSHIYGLAFNYNPRDNPLFAEPQIVTKLLQLQRRMSRFGRQLAGDLVGD